MNGVANELEDAQSSVDIMGDARCHLEATIGVMNARMELLDDGVADAARSLLKIALSSLIQAMDGNTVDLQEHAGRCLYEANAVLNMVATEADDAATWGALTLLGLSRKMLESATSIALREEQAAA